MYSFKIALLHSYLHYIHCSPEEICVFSGLQWGSKIQTQEGGTVMTKRRQTYPLLVDYGRSAKKGIKAGRYNSVNFDIAFPKFPTSQEGTAEVEMERVFDICHGCRRCFNLCDSFPRLFDLIDNGPTGELDGVLNTKRGNLPFCIHMVRNITNSPFL